ncbi:amino acid ABC transporter permease [Alsobacter metallidurans]|uniref:Amino acid ABC transporter permease n=1 Tax=Alsobacter metallidurans TaxID=340221 RepID=A0A917I7D7_9HYPH|nr:branched-chain amino acid ABC transporter permease [Alsobacter metallidurans]GGH18460.1 amino acid ABC transporter permease [Alsobacter metallidurans]
MITRLVRTAPPRALLLLGLLLAVLLAAPLALDRYLTSVLILVFWFAYVGQAWNIMMGFAGLLSLGHALYVGLGAYVAATLFVKLGIGPWAGLWLSAFVSVAVGAAIGWLGFRFRIEGVYFSLLTIAFAEVARIGFDHIGWTGGAAGLFLPVSAEAGAWFNLRGGPLFFYYLALMMATAAFVLCAALRASRLGYRWLAVREDAEAARALGIDVFRARMAAVLISAGLTSLGGVFYAFYYNNLFPGQVFDISRSIEMILAPIVGGVGTLFGPVLGAFILTPLGEALIAITGALGLNAPGTKAVFYGVCLMAIVILAPNGLWPALKRRLGVPEGDV